METYNNYILFCIKCNVNNYWYVGYSKRLKLYDVVRNWKILETNHKLKKIAKELNYETIYIKSYKNITTDEIKYKRNILLNQIRLKYPEANIINREKNNIDLLYIDIDEQI
jgi:hypothetical protein